MGKKYFQAVFMCASAIELIVNDLKVKKVK